MIPRTFCYPGNSFNDTVVEMASRNRVGTRTQQYAVGSKTTPTSLDQWIADPLVKRDWGITMTHGITYSYDSFPAPAVLWDHLKKVKALSDSIWVGTFEEVVGYTKEQQSIRLSISKSKNAIFITPQLPLDKTLFTSPLTMVLKQTENRKVQVKQNGKNLPVHFFSDKAVFDFNPYGGIIQVYF